MARPEVLRHEEGVRLNAERLVALYAELGESGAERVIRDAMEELLARLTELRRFADGRNTSAVIRSTRLIAAVADQIGLTTLGAVARDVLRTTEAGDWPGHAATLARLLRIAERSLCAVWDLHGMTV
ncbi:MAG: hypothetical protein R3E44_03940 [Paracoccaceae bacterium]